jgi:hypothetical protein
MEWSEPGSLIWNAARHNKGMITDHTFWELQGGTSTLFWSDSWQQLPALDKVPTLSTFIPLTTGTGLQKVVDFWIPEENRDTWRKWKNTHEELNIPPEVNLQPLLDQLNSRRIFSQQGEDILRWGHSNTGTFNLQEAYFLSAGHNSLPKEEFGTKSGAQSSGQKSTPSFG